MFLGQLYNNNKGRFVPDIILLTFATTLGNPLVLNPMKNVCPNSAPKFQKIENLANRKEAFFQTISKTR